MRYKELPYINKNNKEKQLLKTNFLRVFNINSM